LVGAGGRVLESAAPAPALSRKEHDMGRKRALPDGMEERRGREGYYSNFQKDGRRVRKFLSTDFKAACQILNDLRARADRAEFGLLDNNYPLAELQQQYLAHCKQALAPNTVRSYTDCLDTIVPALGVVKVSQLATPGILAFRERRLAQGRSPRTVNAEVGALSTMLTWGAAKDVRLIGSNPIEGLKPLPHDNPKEGRPLTDEEVPRLLEASPPYWRNIWYAFLVTGLRKGELAGLQFTPEFLDWENREVIVPAWLAKNGKQRRVPMDDRLYEILRRLEAERADRQPGKGRGKVSAARVEARFSRDHVFVTRSNTPLDHKGNLWRALMRCLEKAGIERETHGPAGRLLEHVDVHSLRRTFATSLIVGGADPKTVQELLGHKTLAMTMKIYAKVRGTTKRQALGRLPYGSGATGPSHVLPLPETGPKCHPGDTSSQAEPQRKAE
jgi:integrase